jgi:hypothetical protein
MPDDDALIRRRNFLRITLMVVIIGTLPFYCIGFFLWGNAPQSQVIDGTTTATATQSSGGGVTDGSPTSALTASWTPLALVTNTALPPLFATPTQFFPPVFPTLGGFPTATFVFIPTSTPAPTLTFAPTNPPPPTNTQPPLPLPTFTWTWTPIVFPTDTDEPLPTPEPPTAEPPTPEPLPFDTPIPTP